MDERFYNIFMYLYYKNILKYAQSGPKSMIHHNESHSTIHQFSGIFRVITSFYKRNLDESFHYMKLIWLNFPTRALCRCFVLKSICKEAL